MTEGTGTSYDVAVIGAGVAGCLVAWSLARRGLKVAVLEAGPRLETAEVFERFTKSDDPYYSACYPSLDYAPRPMEFYPDRYHRNEGPDNFATDYVRAVGGTTWHWAGAATRLGAREMKLRTHYGVGRDWPIGYDTLEPYYCQAERELGVAGDDTVEAGSPRSEPYPLPAMPVAYVDKQVDAVFSRHGVGFEPLPQARNSIAYDGRPACRGNNTCTPICPIDAKYTAGVHARKAEQAGAVIVAEAQVERLLSDDANTIRAAVYRRRGGERQELRARHFVLAANTFETPKILLASADARNPNGLANTSDQVGRNLMGHPHQLLMIQWAEPVFGGRGPAANTCSHAFRDGAFKRDRAGCTVMLENFVDIGSIVAEATGMSLSGEELDARIRHKATRQFAFYAFGEELPDPANRIMLDPTQKDSSGQPRINIRFKSGEYAQRGVRHVVSRIRSIARETGAFEVESQRGGVGGVHISGTTLMGDDRATSVIDPDGRTHDHANLFIAGGSVFPSSGTAHPTLTIAALSLRAADRIAEQMR